MKTELASELRALLGKAETKAPAKKPEPTESAPRAKSDILSEMHEWAGLTPEDDLSSFDAARRTRAETALQEDVLSGMAGWVKGLDKAIGTWQGKAGNAKADAKVMDGLNDVRKAVLRLQGLVGGT